MAETAALFKVRKNPVVTPMLRAARTDIANAKAQDRLARADDAGVQRFEQAGATPAIRQQFPTPTQPAVPAQVNAPAAPVVPIGVGDIDPPFQPIVTQTSARREFQGFTPPAQVNDQSLVTPLDRPVPQTGVSQFGLRPLVRTPDPTVAQPFNAGTGDSISPTRFGTGELTEFQGQQSPGDAAVDLANRTKIAEVVEEGPLTEAQGTTGAAPLTPEQLAETPVTPAGPGSRVFTDAANAGGFPGATIVTQDEQGRNVYKDAAGNVVNIDARFADQGPRPEFRGNTAPDALTAFTRSATPGLTITDGPVAVAGGGATPGTFNAAGETGFRGRTAAPAGTAPGSGEEGALSAAATRNLNALNAGLVNVQARFDAATASGDQAEIDRTRLALVSHNADIARVKMGEGLSTAGDIQPRDEIEAAILKNLPDASESGLAGTRHKMLRQLQAKRLAERVAETNELNAQATFRSSAKSGRTEAQERLTNAKAAMEEFKLENEGSGIDFKSAMDESGNIIAGGLITWPGQNIAVPAENWADIQALANDGGAFFEDVKAKAPKGTPRKDIYDTALRHAMLAHSVK